MLGANDQAYPSAWSSADRFRDFRDPLTCIGGFAPVYIAEELANNQFKIGRWPRRDASVLAGHRHSPGPVGERASHSRRRREGREAEGLLPSSGAVRSASPRSRLNGRGNPGMM